MATLKENIAHIANPFLSFGSHEVATGSSNQFRWIADEDGKVFIYYASSDTRMHVATSTVDKL